MMKSGDTQWGTTKAVDTDREKARTEYVAKDVAASNGQNIKGSDGLGKRAKEAGKHYC